MIHYFIKDDSNSDWHDVRLEAWKEDTHVYYRNEQEEASSFKCIEEIRFHASKHPNKYHSVTLNIDFAKDSCHGTRHRNIRDLIKEISQGIFPKKHSTKEEYEALRKRLFDFYLKEPHINLDEIKPDGDYSITNIF